MAKKRVKENKVIIILVMAATILILILGIYGCTNTEARIETRLKTKLKNTAAEIFETEQWLDGTPAPDTYVATLNDLKYKLGKDITLFEKYKCNQYNTKVEFIVMQPKKAGETNFKYNIILSCDF